MAMPRYIRKKEDTRNTETKQFEEIMAEYESIPKENKKIKSNRENFGKEFI